MKFIKISFALLCERRLRRMWSTLINDIWTESSLKSQKIIIMQKGSSADCFLHPQPCLLVCLHFIVWLYYLDLRRAIRNWMYVPKYNCITDREYMREAFEKWAFLFRRSNSHLFLLCVYEFMIMNHSFPWIPCKMHLWSIYSSSLGAH